MIFSAKELDIPKILILISSYTKTKSARDYILNMTPSTDLIEIETSLRQTEDINNHLLRVGQLPLIEDFDIFEILKLLPRGFILSGSDIMQIRLFLTMEKSVLEAFLYAKKLNITYNIIHEQISLITNHQSLLKMIDSIFDERGIIYDNASPGLSKIRRNISLKQKELDDKMRSFLDKYKDYLAENIITTRNNRYCIPVNITYKNKIKGTVLDISKTGQTVYIEPEVAFNIQSELEYLAVLENEEIQKILSILTNEIASSYDNLMKNLDIFLLLDVLHAKAMYARDIDGVMPRVNKEGKINIIKGRHPLIKKEQVVPIDVILNNEFKTMIITGPNTGGKTVALKTTGIFSVMTQMGILVSCDPQSDIAIFDNIFADIGDEQSIEQSLSTFSSHLKKIKNIMDNAKSNDLVLIDEIGSGTDPQEGSSLAIAILNHLRKKNLRLMVTTHYSDLKIYALENDGIMSASVAFDEKTLSPLYYLVLGSSGTSNAFLIAKEWE
ncbi:hypothetical protein LJC17_00795 [Acholeplasma sp. OttesenSCG-928-E16]|nr:hypothetical protein [Acholeplasma sp. OttesenSCG-928-E16]